MSASHAHAQDAGLLTEPIRLDIPSAPNDAQELLALLRGGGVLAEILGDDGELIFPPSLGIDGILVGARSHLLDVDPFGSGDPDPTLLIAARSEMEASGSHGAASIGGSFLFRPVQGGLRVLRWNGAAGASAADAWDGFEPAALVSFGKEPAAVSFQSIPRPAPTAARTPAAPVPQADDLAMVDQAVQALWRLGGEGTGASVAPSLRSRAANFGSRSRSSASSSVVVRQGAYYLAAAAYLGFCRKASASWRLTAAGRAYAQCLEPKIRARRLAEAFLATPLGRAADLLMSAVGGVPDKAGLSPLIKRHGGGGVGSSTVGRRAATLRRWLSDFSSMDFAA